MAQFVAYDPNVKVKGQSILSVVNAMEIGRAARQEILKRHGLANVNPEEWFDQQKWLSALKDINSTLGENTLFIIGKAIPENAAFPPEINSIEKALKSIDQVYHMNHKNGEIGHYKLTEFDAKNKRAVMVCDTPYPSNFDRGIIIAMVARFRPKDSIKYDVVLDKTKQNRVEGGDSCTYIITW